MKTLERTQVVALVVAAVIGAAACSSGDASTTDTTVSAPSSASTTEVAAATTAPTTTEVAAATLQVALDEIQAETAVPALGAAVFDSSGPIDTAVTGMRERDGSTPAEIDDRFHLGSNTKAMTAALLARISEQGRGLSFDTTLAEAFPTATEIHADYATVTLAQLLAHSGGVPTADDPDPDPPTDAQVAELLALPVVEQRALLADVTISQPPFVEPNTVSRYSNMNYVIVGAAMEAATGESWEDLITAELFTPLGMTSCGFGPPGVEGQVDQPLGHDLSTGLPVYGDNPSFLGPAGTVHCSMEDYGRFLTELLRGTKGESDFLTQTSVDRLLEPVPVPAEGQPSLRFALGWGVTDWRSDEPAYTHDGSNTLFYASALLVPAFDRAAVAVSNEASAGQQATALAIQALIELYPV